MDVARTPLEYGQQGTKKKRTYRALRKRQE
jgi:hypothetical protein